MKRRFAGVSEVNAYRREADLCGLIRLRENGREVGLSAGHQERNPVSRCLMLYARIEWLGGEVFGVSNFTLLGMLSSQSRSSSGGCDQNSGVIFLYTPFKAALLHGRTRCIWISAL
jgi:hypothetical protein